MGAPKGARASMPGYPSSHVCPDRRRRSRLNNSRSGEKNCNVEGRVQGSGPAQTVRPHAGYSATTPNLLNTLNGNQSWGKLGPPEAQTHGQGVTERSCVGVTQVLHHQGPPCPPAFHSVLIIYSSPCQSVSRIISPSYLGPMTFFEN